MKRAEWILLAAAVLLPGADLLLEAAGLSDWRIGDEVCQRVLPYAILGLGLNVIVGYTGLLHLGVAAFMAIGVYAYAILTCDVYPFQIGFWPALFAAPAVAALVGVLLGAPTLGLRGDYLAIVTLGFGEIVQDVLKNADTITKGMQGINPLPPPFVTERYELWYALYLGILVVMVLLTRNLERSRLGRQWMAIREDELAAVSMGITPVKTKLLAFAITAAVCGLAGVLWAAKLGTTAEPSSYDFNVSITVLSILIVGGMGSLRGVLAGATIVMGFDILLRKVSDAVQRAGIQGDAVFMIPSNWKFMIFGVALVLMMRFKPDGLLPPERTR